jgi:hypothetical protein
MGISRRTTVALAFLAAYAVACAANDFSGRAPAARVDAPDSTLVTERVCMDALDRLDTRLTRSVPDAAVPAADLVEARALRSQAIEMIATGDYALALDLIREAAAVLDRSRR